jgi:hypothetical protein
MGNRQDDRSSRMGSRNDGRDGGGSGRGDVPRGDRDGRVREAGPPERQSGEPGRPFDRNEDMGGSGWSGASGRGGFAERGGGDPRGGYPNQGQYTQSGYNCQNGYGRYAPQSGYPGDTEYGNAYAGGGYAAEGRHEDHDDGGFLTEDTPGHVPNQRWSGGYGADRDRERERHERERGGYGTSGPPSGRGFTGNDFGGLPRQRDRAYGAPAGLGPRHFGNVVDRGGRMGPGGGETTGRGYWGWESDRASGVNMGQMGGREGYGFQGTDMGMGAPEEDRGPHWGKGPKGYKRSDERTRDDVCDAIAHQGHIDASDVEVKVTDGIVTLSGTVFHRHDKRRLEHIAEHCRGVHEVHNELRLKRTEQGAAKDRPQDKREQQGKQGEPSDGTGSSNGNKNGKTARA